MKRAIIATLAALMLLLCLCTGCTADRDYDVAGKYVATACYDGDTEVEVAGEYMILEADGTGQFVLLGMVYPITWTLDGSNFSFDDRVGDTFSGTFEDGVIEGTYFDEFSYVLEKEDSFWDLF